MHNDRKAAVGRTPKSDDEWNLDPNAPRWLDEGYHLLLDALVMLRDGRNKKDWGRPYKYLGKPFDQTREHKKRTLAVSVALFVVVQIAASVWLRGG